MARSRKNSSIWITWPATYLRTLRRKATGQNTGTERLQKHDWLKNPEALEVATREEEDRDMRPEPAAKTKHDANANILRV
ncbi:hypothetical protein IFR05_011668 [Cadophora sp. M221]|nr:hypothetical protein IFR05_011668 [Cadophora sp. M221]